MPTKRRRVTRHGTPPRAVSAALYHLLTWDDFAGACRLAAAHTTNPWECFDNGTHQSAWRAIEDRALRDWVAIYPGTRPRSWWQWSAPDVRDVIGRFRLGRGVDRCWATGVPHGAPEDVSDPPLVETEPAYLDRWQLWLPDERARVSPAAFAPVRWCWALLRAGGSFVR